MKNRVLIYLVLFLATFSLTSHSSNILANKNEIDLNNFSQEQYKKHPHSTLAQIMNLNKNLEHCKQLIEYSVNKEIINLDTLAYVLLRKKMHFAVYWLKTNFKPDFDEILAILLRNNSADDMFKNEISYILQYKPNLDAMLASVALDVAFEKNRENNVEMLVKDFEASLNEALNIISQNYLDDEEAEQNKERYEGAAYRLINLGATVKEPRIDDAWTYSEIEAQKWAYKQFKNFQTPKKRKRQHEKFIPNKLKNGIPPSSLAKIKLKAGKSKHETELSILEEVDLQIEKNKPGRYSFFKSKSKTFERAEEINNWLTTMGNAKETAFYVRVGMLWFFVEMFEAEDKKGVYLRQRTGKNDKYDVFDKNAKFYSAEKMMEIAETCVYYWINLLDN